MTSFEQKQKSFWVGSFIGFYTFLLSFFCFRKYAAFAYHDFDLAVYVQAVWNLLHGSLQSTILGVPFMGNHFVPILFLVTPFYALFPSPLTLLFLQTLLMGGGAWFVYRLALRLLDEPLALILSGVYLLYPSLAYVNLFEFHPVAFAIFFLLGALDAFERERLRSFVIFLLLALACQEDVSLMVVALGLYALLRRRRPVWILVPLGLGVGWFCLFVLILMPIWNPETINFSLLYSHLGDGPLAVFGSILRHPVRALSLAFEGAERKLFIWKHLAPLLMLPLLDPKSFLLTLPAFLEQLLSRRYTQHLLILHYSALLIPFLFFASIHGLKNILRLRWVSSNRRLLSLVMIGSAAVTALTIGPFRAVDTLLAEGRADLMDQKREQLIRMVPKEASVVATFEFLSHLAHRSQLYSLHHLYTGAYTLSTTPYVFPEEIDFLLVDFNDPLTHAFSLNSKDADKRLVKFLKGWKVRQAFGGLVLMERGEGPFLMAPVKRFSRPDSLLTTVDETFVLRGVYGFSDEGRVGEAVPFTFFWECLKPTDKSYGLLFNFLDGPRVVHQVFHPIGYRAFPTTRWRKGDRFEERYSLVLPKPPRGKSGYELQVLWVDEERQQTVPVRTGDVEEDRISFGLMEVKDE